MCEKCRKGLANIGDTIQYAMLSFAGMGKMVQMAYPGNPNIETGELLFTEMQKVDPALLPDPQQWLEDKATEIVALFNAGKTGGSTSVH